MMKPADIVTVKTSDGTFKVKVEDASKGDVIGGRVEAVLSGDSPLQVGSVAEFRREDVQEK